MELDSLQNVDWLTENCHLCVLQEPFLKYISAQQRGTFLGIISEERVQRELDGMVRNENVFQHVSERMAAEGFQRTSEQCRIKFKKLWSDYRKVKDHSSQSGVNRKNWK